MTRSYDTFTCPVKGCAYHDSGWTDDGEFLARAQAHARTHIEPLEGRLIDAITIPPGTKLTEQHREIAALLAQAPKGTELVLTLHAWEVRR